MIVALTKAAKRDISDAAAWYEQQREGLGAEFIDSVDEGIGKIALNPLGYAVVSGENRRCVVDRFPYALWFKVRDNVVVVGCLHHRRALHLSKERGLGVIEFRKPKP